MDQQSENKEFITSYFNAISGVSKVPELIARYITDEALLAHISFFESVLPQYEMFADEMTAEGNRVVVRARCKGRHEGDLNGIAPTYRTVEFPFAIGYTIENKKIAHHWLIADRMSLMEQLGVMDASKEDALH